jgi:predicted nucleotide-binding protein (sugar kinase/HSP70/actin superfamily)
MGNMYIALQALMNGLQLEFITPPPISKRTLELGVKYSPEFVCLPMKINLGNFIEALEMGADIIVMGGGWGPCRFGYYAQIEREILQELGYDFQMIVLEAPDSKARYLIKQLQSLGQNVSLRQALQSIKFAWDKMTAVEQVEKGLEYYLPRTIKPNEAERIYEQGLKEIIAAANGRQSMQIARQTVQMMQKLEVKAQEPLVIGLVGEVYTVLEPAANYEITKILGRLGAEVRRTIYMTDWVNDHLLGGHVKASNRQQILKSARPYLNYWVGGHGQETIGTTVAMARQGCDGILQIGPLTCMPEIVAQTILPLVSEKEGVPCMTLWFDELTGTAGVQTRLEAFIDMVGRRKYTSVKEA